AGQHVKQPHVRPSRCSPATRHLGTSVLGCAGHAGHDTLATNDVGMFETMVAAAATATEWRPPSAFDEYRLLDVIGQGAMGRLHRAHDTLLDRLLSVKFIAALVPDDDARREHFLVEARAIARLQHPNVVM